MLAAFKLGAFVMTGSMIALGSAFDSVSDTVISALNAWAHKASRRRPDRGHPFGHGGIEVLTSFLQGLALVGLASYLAYRSSLRLFGLGPAEGLDRAAMPIAIVILALSAAASLGLNALLARARQEHARGHGRSLSLDADKAHYAGDAIAGALGTLGLVVVWRTGDDRVDAVLGIVAAAFLARVAWPILRRATSDIVHRGADRDVRRKIREAARGADPQIMGVHRLRTREHGPTLFVDFHVVLPAAMPLAQAHDIAEKAAGAVRRAFPRADVLVHVDPDSEPAERDLED